MPDNNVYDLRAKLETYVLYKQNAEEVISENRKLLRKQADALIDSQHKLAAAEAEIDKTREHWFKKYQQSCSHDSAVCIKLTEERAHNAVLRSSLEDIKNINTIGCEGIGDTDRLNEVIRISDYALAKTPSASAAKVEKLVDALAHIDGCLSESEHNAIIALEIAQKALAEWRGE